MSIPNVIRRGRTLPVSFVGRTSITPNSPRISATAGNNGMPKVSGVRLRITPAFQPDFKNDCRTEDGMEAICSESVGISDGFCSSVHRLHMLIRYNAKVLKVNNQRFPRLFQALLKPENFAKHSMSS